MILRVLAVSMIGFTLAGCVSSSGLSGDVYSASEAKQVQSVTYGTIVHTRAVQIQAFFWQFETPLENKKSNSPIPFFN